MDKVKKRISYNKKYEEKTPVHSLHITKKS